MLDPLTALSLAGTIVQFVDFGSKIISKSRDLARSSTGTSEEASNHEIIINDLLKLSRSLREQLQTANSSGSADDDNQTLQAVCTGCIQLSERLLARLNSVKIQANAGKRKIFRLAVRAVWSQKEIHKLHLELGDFRNQIELHVLISFRWIILVHINPRVALTYN